MMQTSETPSLTAAAIPPGSGACAVPLPPNVADLPALAMRVLETGSAAELEGWIPQWRRLVDQAAEANAFHEPGFLLPALRHLAGNEEIRVVLVVAPPRVNPAGPPVLCGLFPLRLGRRMNGLPVRFAEIWRHDQCFLSTPLIRRDVLEETWLAFWNWLQEGSLFGKSRCDWFSLPMQTTGGAVHGMLVDWIEREKTQVLVRRRYRRAFLRRPACYASFLQQSVPRRIRQESGRLRRRLEQQGPLRTEVSSGSAEAAAFFRLELAGWKGETRTALASQSDTRAFAEEMSERMGAAGQLQVLQLLQGNRIVAGKLNLLTGAAGFAWKIAFDSGFSAWSPGVMMELENVRQIAETGSVEWMDSCADPGHPMIDHLWPERRGIESLLLACGTRRGRWMLAARPLIQGLSAGWRGKSAARQEP